MSNLTRIRLTRLPAARDLEYLVLRYLQVDGVYEVPTQVANDLIEFGYALPGSRTEPLTGLTDALTPELLEDLDE
jgi:hypothetical protein